MKNTFIFTGLIAAALLWSCNNGGEGEITAEQNFTNAYGTYHGTAASIQADSLILTFEAGTFTGGRPSGEAKRLTVTCLVPTMFEDQRYLGDGNYTAASAGGELPVFIPGSVGVDGNPTGTYLDSWTGAGARTAVLFTGGSMDVAYSDQSEKYTITASLTDAAGNIFSTTYVGELNLTIPEVVPERLENLIAAYYGDGNGTTPQHWILDVFNDITGTGGYTGIILDIHANRVFAEGANSLQEGEYRIGAGGDTGTYLPGSYGNGTHTGSYYYIMDKYQNITGGFHITGGTFTISRNTDDIRYTLRTNLSGRNFNDGAEEDKTILYEGNPIYLDMGGTEPEEIIRQTSHYKQPLE